MTAVVGTIYGLDDMRTILEQIAPKHARNLLRATVLSSAAVVGKTARQFAPRGHSRRLKRAIKWRRRKSTPQLPIAEVYVNRGTSRGDPDGAFYWHFLEYGTAPFKNHPGIPEQPYIRPAKVEFQKRKNRIIETEFRKKLNAKIKREQKKRRR